MLPLKKSDVSGEPLASVSLVFIAVEYASLAATGTSFTGVTLITNALASEVSTPPLACRRCRARQR